MSTQGTTAIELSPQRQFFRETPGTTCTGTWEQCGALAPEERLSRLAAWVLAAHRAGVDFGLRLPAAEVPLAQGDAHRRACLEALALWR